MLRDRLRKQHARLLEFQGRSDLKVADVITLSEHLSKVEAELEAAERDGAVHQRRIETQMLSIEFSPFAREEQRGEIVGALRDSGSVMATSAGGVIRVAAALIPVLLGLAIAVWVLRWVWRWLRRKKKVER
jgi:predicted nucleic acid-binding protein